MSGPAIENGFGTRKTPRGAWFSPGGTHLAVAYHQGTDVLWCLTNRLVTHETGPRAQGVGDDLAFLPDNREVVTLGSDRRLRVVDLASGAELDSSQLAGSPRWLKASRFTNEVAVAHADRIEFWKPGASRPMQALSVASLPAAIDWHRDDRWLAIGLWNGELLLWDRVANHRVVIPSHTTAIERLGFSPDGDLVWSTGYDGTTRFREAVSGQLLSSTRDGQGWCYSRDGTRLSFLDWENNFGVWPVQRPASLRFLHLPDLREEVRNMSLSADGRWLIAGTSTGWRLLDLVTAREIARHDQGQWMRAIFHPQETSVIGLAVSEVKLWPLTWVTNEGAIRVEVGAVSNLWSHPGAELRRVSCRNDGRAIVAAGYGASAIVPLPPDQWAPIRFARNSPAAYAASSPDGRTLAVAGPGRQGITVWHPPFTNAARTLVPRDEGQVEFSPDGRTLVTLGHEITLWDTTTWEKRLALPSREPPLNDRAMAFSGDGQLLAVIEGYQRIKLLRADTGSELATLTPPVRPNIMAMAMSANGETLVATTETRIIYVWNLRALRQELAVYGLDWR